jgi:hypothetical protein
MCARLLQLHVAGDSHTALAGCQPAQAGHTLTLLESADARADLGHHTHACSGYTGVNCIQNSDLIVSYCLFVVRVCCCFVLLL